MSLVQADQFLLRTTFTARRETIVDTAHRPVAWVVRRYSVWRSTLAVVAVCVILGFTGYALSGAVRDLVAWELRASFEQVASPPRYSTLIGVALIAVAVSVVAARYVLPKWSVVVCADRGCREKLFEVEQDARWPLAVVRYVVRDADGQTLATLERNRLLSLLQEHWTVAPAVGAPIVCRTSERPVILGPLRRLLGSTCRLLQTRVALVTADAHRSGDVRARFDRRHVELGRSVLDVSTDPTAALDRRIALALGVLLSAGR
jgi:hypothetical protein